VISPWVERTAANERRVANWRDQQWPGPERRLAERRHYRHAADSAAAPGKEKVPPGSPFPSDRPPPDHSSYLTSEVMAAKRDVGQDSLPESQLNDSSIVISGKF